MCVCVCVCVRVCARCDYYLKSPDGLVESWIAVAFLLPL